MKWSISGLHPGMMRTQVLQLKGEPAGDGGFGKAVQAIPAGSAVNWQEYAVWHYGGVAVVFREDVVVQVLGSRLELDGRPVSRSEGMEQRQHGVLSIEAHILGFRLLPIPVRNPLPERAPLLRTRLEGLEGSRSVSFDLECREKLDLAMYEDWVEGTCQGLRWKPLALRRALWECLHYGDRYWHSSGGGRLVGHIVSTNSWDAEPAQVRLRLLVDSEIRLAQRRGKVVPSKVAMDEMDVRECAGAWQRLMLVGHSPAPALWQGAGWGHPPVRMLEGNLPTDSLRWAAALARLVDEGRASQPFMYPGPPEGEYEIGLALAGPRGRSGWSWKAAAAPDILFDWSDARHRFHAQWTPAGAVLKAFDKDRLGEVVEVMERLSEVGDFVAGQWDGNWGNSLPGNEKERELLREVERAPHFDRPVHHLAIGLRRIAAAAGEWLPLDLSRDQRMLAGGLALILQSRLEVLDVIAAAPTRAGREG